MELRVRIERLPHAEGLPLPAYMTPESAGMDLYAALSSEIILGPGEIALVPTGIRIALPSGCEAQIRPRSGLAIGSGLTVVNAPGTIDPDYRGEVKVGLINLGKRPVTIQRGDRIAQMIVAEFRRVEWEEVDGLDRTERGEGGFGHTGRR